MRSAVAAGGALPPTPRLPAAAVPRLPRHPAASGERAPVALHAKGAEHGGVFQGREQGSLRRRGGEAAPLRRRRQRQRQQLLLRLLLRLFLLLLLLLLRRRCSRTRPRKRRRSLRSSRLTSGSSGSGQEPVVVVLHRSSPQRRRSGGRRRVLGCQDRPPLRVCHHRGRQAQKPAVRVAVRGPFQPGDGDLELEPGREAVAALEWGGGGEVRRRGSVAEVERSRGSALRCPSCVGVGRWRWAHRFERTQPPLHHDEAPPSVEHLLQGREGDVGGVVARHGLPRSSLA